MPSRRSRCGDGCRRIRRAEGEAFPGLTVSLLVLVGAWLLRHDSGAPNKAHSDGRWRIVRWVLVFLMASER